MKEGRRRVERLEGRGGKRDIDRERREERGEKEEEERGERERV